MRTTIQGRTVWTTVLALMTVPTVDRRGGHGFHQGFFRNDTGAGALFEDADMLAGQLRALADRVLAIADTREETH